MEEYGNIPNVLVIRGKGGFYANLQSNTHTLCLYAKVNM
jgi:hypothetical protein